MTEEEPIENLAVREALLSAQREWLSLSLPGDAEASELLRRPEPVRQEPGEDKRATAASVYHWALEGVTHVDVWFGDEPYPRLCLKLAPEQGLHLVEQLIPDGVDGERRGLGKSYHYVRTVKP